MRQEMKVGFAIGGVLLAVLVVYVLVVSGRDHKGDQVALDTGDPTVSFQPDHAGVTAKTTDTKTNTGALDPGKTPEVPHTDLVPDQVVKGPTTQESTSIAMADKNDPWASALSTGRVPVPTLLSQTPTPKSPAADTTGDLTMPSKLQKINFGSSAKLKTETASPATQPASAEGSHTHTVTSGETVSSIATAAYGNAAFYPHILRANLSVDPKKLKVGTVLTIPPLGEDKAVATTTDKPAGPPTALGSNDFTPKKPVDDKTQYVVLPGDSLYRISVKLYGKADHIDKIAEANKGEIGAERRLKVGQVLALPEPPTAIK